MNGLLTGVLRPGYAAEGVSDRAWLESGVLGRGHWPLIAVDAGVPWDFFWGSWNTWLNGN